MAQPNETLPILGRLCGTTSVISHRLNSVVLEKMKMRVVEMEDVLFHLDSAVFMPENPEAKKNENDKGDDAYGELAEEGQKVVTGVEALAIVFKQLEFDPEGIVLVAAHADTSGSYDHNFMLTDLRGENVLRFLTGEMDRWAEICATQHNIEDYQQILSFTAKKKPDWGCDPNGIDNKWGPDTKKATEAFLNNTCPYNAEEIMKTIEKDPKKKWPVEVWLEVYKIYNDVLKARLDLPDEKMGSKREHLRDRISMLPQGWVACGEMWPIEAATKDNYRSKENRRVEILIFDQKDDFRPECMQQCIEKKEKASADKYRELCPIWPFRNRLIPLYIDKLDLDSYAYHLRFVYYDRIKKRNGSVPDGLKIRCFEVPKDSGSAKTPDPVEVSTEQIYRNGTYFVKVQFPRICTSDNAPQDFYFTYSGADTYVYTADDKSEPVIAVKTSGEINAMTNGERNKYHALQKDWTSKDCRTFYFYDFDYDGDFEYGDKFLNVVENELKLRPFGIEITDQIRPLTFVADYVLDDTPAAILHPAIGCPAIVVKDNDKYTLTCIIFGVDNKQHADQEITARKVNDHLKFVNWETGLDNCCEEDTLKPFSAIRAGRDSRVLQAKRALLHKKPLPEEFNNRIYYTEEDIKANIKVTPLGSSEPDGFWRDSDGIYWSDACSFTLSTRGMNHFSEDVYGINFEKYYHVTITLPSYMAQGCYNIFWLNKGQEPEDLFLQSYLARKGNTTDGDDEQPELLGPRLVDHMMEQDIGALPNNFILYSMPVDLGKTPAISKKQGEMIYTMTNIDVDSPVCSYHPVYLTENQYPGIACIGDMHIASRMALLAKSKVKMIPYSDAANKQISDEMVTVGSLVSDPFVVACDLFAKAGNDPEIDVVLITGDFIDYLKSFFPQQAPLREDDYFDKTYTTPQSIREAVDFTSKSDASRLYQDGIDLINSYSLLVQFMHKFHKPFYVVAGNHDPYYWPWAISPRVGFGTAMVGGLSGNPWVNMSAANPGVPADANMTFYEAILSYGEDYGVILEAQGVLGNLPIIGIVAGDPNLKPEKYELFYTLFTPFVDFSLKMPKWSLCGLFWGNDEDLVDVPGTNQGLGHLPRSEEAITNTQLKLLKRAFSRTDAKNILMSHFTFASYLERLPLEDSNGQRGSEGDLEFDITWNAQDFDMGTFEINRKELYENMLFQKKPGIDFIFTGHMHRRGLYDITGIDYSGDNSVKCRFWDVNNTDYARTRNDSVRIFVPDSCGNIPRFNRRGEFLGWGSDTPSLIKCCLDSNGAASNVDHLYSDVSRSKPRLAVGLDYLFNVEGINFIDSFQTSRMGESQLINSADMIFNLQIRSRSDEFNYRCIPVERVDLFVYVNDRFYCIEGTPAGNSGGAIQIRFVFPAAFTPEEFKLACGLVLPNAMDQTPPDRCRSFLSFKFANPGVGTYAHQVLGQYDFSSRYNFAAILVYVRDMINNDSIQIQRMSRHSVNQVPDWLFVETLESGNYWQT